MTIKEILDLLTNSPEDLEFGELINTIDTYYEFTPCAFTNGEVINELGSNLGSCKLFYFGILYDLTKEQMLHCFGTYYRVDVLEYPSGNDHQNIRNFMKTGWGGIIYEGVPLKLKRK